ncbi:MAG: large-conductance mechanosensitive channel protein MscL [Bacteroidales bacterium]|nr:large-conductance mechanosensitive channel protein MscL [Bacteroidales bacterium]
MKKFLEEFKTFAVKGNVIDMAVGIIIGAAFGKIVSSLVSDVIMPPIGVLIGGVDFTDLSITIKSAVVDTECATMSPAVVVRYGSFLQTTFDFLIVAFCVFLLIKGITTLRKMNEAAPAPAQEPAPTKEEQLLTEIRDLLKDKQK